MGNGWAREDEGMHADTGAIIRHHRRRFGPGCWQWGWVEVENLGRYFKTEPGDMGWEGKRVSRADLQVFEPNKWVFGYVFL